MFLFNKYPMENFFDTNKDYVSEMNGDKVVDLARNYEVKIFHVHMVRICVVEWGDTDKRVNFWTPAGTNSDL